MGDILRMTGPAIYGIGAAVVGAKLLTAGIRESWRWLRRNPPRTVADGIALLVMGPPVALLMLVGTAALMGFWPIVAMFTLQRRQQRRRLARLDDAEREAELFREVREAAGNGRLAVVLSSLAAMACADAVPAPEPEPAAAAARILAGSGRALGAADGQDLHVLAEADVTGPDGSTFTTALHSATDGRVRMSQPENGFLAGIGQEAGWLVDASEGITDLGGFRAFLRGHELHLLALAPNARLHEATLRPPTLWNGHDAWAVDARLETGESLVAYYAMADTTPIGLLLQYTDPPVAVTWDDWMDRGGFQVFRTAVFREGSDAYTYRYRRVEIGPLPDSVFEAPARN